MHYYTFIMFTVFLETKIEFLEKFAFEVENEKFNAVAQIGFWNIGSQFTASIKAKGYKVNEFGPEFLKFVF